MRNPFAPPRTAGQWLLGSALWMTVCLAIWAMLTYPIVYRPTLPFEYEKYESILLFISFIFPYAFVWMKASPMAEVTDSRFLIVEALVALWRVVLYAGLMGWL